MWAPLGYWSRGTDLGGRIDGFVGIEPQYEGAARAIKPHLLDSPLHIACERPAKSFHRAAARIGVSGIVLLVAREDRQIFLVPAVANAQVVSVRGGVVPLSRIEQQRIECIIHQTQQQAVLVPNCRVALTPGPSGKGSTFVKVVGDTELADQCGRTVGRKSPTPRSE